MKCYVNPEDPDVGVANFVLTRIMIDSKSYDPKELLELVEVSIRILEKNKQEYFLILLILYDDYKALHEHCGHPEYA